VDRPITSSGTGNTGGGVKLHGDYTEVNNTLLSSFC